MLIGMGNGGSIGTVTMTQLKQMATSDDDALAQKISEVWPGMLGSAYLTTAKYMDLMTVVNEEAPGLVGYGAYGPHPTISGRSGYFFRITEGGQWLHLRESVTHDYKISYGTPPSDYDMGSDVPAATLVVPVIETAEQAEEKVTDFTNKVVGLEREIERLTRKAEQYGQHLNVIVKHSPEVAANLQAQYDGVMSSLGVVKSELAEITDQAVAESEGVDESDFDPEE